MRSERPDEDFLQEQIEDIAGAGVLVRSVIHRMNNLLGAASGYIELLSFQRSEIPGDGASYLDEINAAITEAGQLSQQFLHFARLRDGGKVRTILQEVISPLVETIQSQLETRGGTLLYRNNSVCELEARVVALREGIRALFALLFASFPEGNISFFLSLVDVDGGVAMRLESEQILNCLKKLKPLFEPRWSTLGMLFRSDGTSLPVNVTDANAALLEVILQAHGGNITIGESGSSSGFICLWLPGVEKTNTL